MMNKLPLSGSEIEEFFARASEEDAYDLLCNSIPTHHNAYDEEQEAARPFLPLGTPPEATLGLHPSALVETVDRKLKELNDQRLAISRSICEYKRLRNSAARVSRLPQELLVKVFLYAPERILAVSQVSAEWRALALATPRLWTDIPLRQRQLAELFLARSGDACVRYRISKLALSAVYPRPEDLQDVLLLGRLKGLHVELGDVRELQLLLEALEGPAPHLEEIQLRFTEPDLDWLVDPIVILVRPTLFDDVTPRLRMLVLDSIEVRWTSGVFANLTKLDVGHQSRLLHPDVDDFLDILERCPFLELLSYRCWIHNLNIGRPQPYSGPAPSRRRQIALRKLDSLTFEYLPSAWTAFVLGNLEAPACTHLRIASCHETGEDDFPLDMLPPDTSRIPALSNMRSLDIEPALPHQLNLHLDPNAFKGWIWSRPLACTLKLLGCDSVSLMYRDVFQKLDIRRLESLTIRDPDNCGIEPHIWPLYLRMAKNLRYLRLIDVSSPDILTALRTAPSWDDDVFCPCLSELALVGGSGGDGLVPELEAYLHYLSKEGRALTTVTLVGAFSDEAVHRLASIGPEIDMWPSAGKIIVS